MSIGVSNPPLTQNSTSNDASLNDLMNLIKKEISLNLNCHHIGTIQSFDATTQTCTATINYTKTIFQYSNGQYIPIQFNYPLCLDVPVIVLGGGQASLTMPIQVGDTCLLLFNDRNFGAWFQNGQVGPVPTPRSHSYADAIAIVGLNSLAKSIQTYDTTRAVLQNGTTGVGVSSSKVKIYNTSTTLNTVLQNILTQLQNLTTALSALTVSGVTTGPGVSGVPVNASAISAVGTQLGTLASQLGNLIE